MLAHLFKECLFLNYANNKADKCGPKTVNQGIIYFKNTFVYKYNTLLWLIYPHLTNNLSSIIHSPKPEVCGEFELKSS